MNPFIKRPVHLLMTGLLVYSILCPGTIHATEPFAKIGTTAGTRVLTIPRGVRNLSLGGIGAADPYSPDNVYYNPAVAFLISGAHVTASQNDYYADLSFRDIGVYAGHAFGKNDRWRFRFGGGLRYTEQKTEPQILRTIYLPESTGGTFDIDDYYFTIALGCGFSVDWFDFGFGFSAKPVTTQIGGADTKFSAYDIGFLMQARFETGSGLRIIPSFGIGQLNLGSDVYRDDYQMNLPDQFRAGIGIRLESPPSDSFNEAVGIDRPVISVGLVAEYVERRYLEDQKGTAVGLETSILDIVFLRINHADNILERDGAFYGLGIGWQFRMVRFRYDYAEIPLKSINNVDHASVHGGTVIVDF